MADSTHTDLAASLADQLDRLVGEEVAAPLQRDKDYLAVAVDSLITGMVLGFRLFLEVDGRFVLFHGRESVFADKDRDRLLLLRQPTVHVHSSDIQQYLAYLEANLKRILNDEQIPAPVKASLVYRSTQGLMREILAYPDDPQIIFRAQQAADVTVNFLLSGRESFLNLLSSCEIDYKTYTHSVHVCIFVVALASRLGLRDEELREISTAALLHDIGKTRIDPAVLNKSGPLGEDARAIVRKHPEWGLEIVRDYPGLTPMIKDIILHHHEKLDGSGYPHGLKADQIPLPVRIVTICDIFDAITTNRAYKKGLSTFETLALMEREMRGQIDFDILIELVLLLRSVT